MNFELFKNMEKLFLIALMISTPCVSAGGSQAFYWHDGNRKINLFKQAYNNEHLSFIYTESPEGKSTQQVLTGRIILSFHSEDKDKLQDILHRYNLVVIKKLPIGNATYLLKLNYSNYDDSLSIANQIYEQEEVKSSYPDWQYLWQS